MALFSFAKKETPKREPYNPNARIKVLGSGCKKCLTLEENAKAAVSELGSNDEITHVYDMETIVSYGVMSTPALVVDEKVVVSGKVSSKEELVDLLK